MIIISVIYYRKGLYINGNSDHLIQYQLVDQSSSNEGKFYQHSLSEDNVCDCTQIHEQGLDKNHISMGITLYVFKCFVRVERNYDNIIIYLD